MAIEIQIRRDTAANWTSVDPTLAQGEFGLETDTNQLKIGDGVLAWTALAYFGGSGNPFDQDLNTTDAVSFTGLTNNAIIYPTVDGTAGQAIVTDGAGNLSFASAANPFDQSLNIADAVSFTGLTNNSIIYPVADGTAGQVIVTDGAGNLSFGSYLPLAGGAMDDTAIVTLSNTGTDRDTEIGGWGLGTQKTSDNDYSATFEYDQILIKDGTQTTTIKTNTITTGGSYIERQVAASFTAGVMTLDCNSANVFTCALTGNVTTLTINNIPTSGKAIGITLILTADGTQRTISWPASFLWSNGNAPIITATNTKKDAIVFMTYDAGTTFLAFVAGQNL